MDPLHPDKLDSRGLPTIRWLERFFAPNTQTCLQHLADLHVFPRPVTCERMLMNGVLCLGRMDQRNPDDIRYFRCSRKSCRKKKSLLQKTVFNFSHIGVEELLKLAYYWLCEDTHASMKTKTGFNKDTVTKWINIFEQLIVWDLSEDDESTKIGGADIIVQVDESKFGKRKYHRGHHVEGVWVVGGVETNTEEKKTFFCTVENRTAETLANILFEKVRAGTTIHTDLWRGYRDEDLRALDLAHGTVNHSLHFIDPETGVHTQNIEGTWSGVKRKTPIRRRTVGLIEGCLSTYIWRKKYHGQLWDRFISILRRFRFVGDEERFD